MSFDHYKNIVTRLSNDKYDNSDDSVSSQVKGDRMHQASSDWYIDASPELVQNARSSCHQDFDNIAGILKRHYKTPILDLDTFGQKM